MLRPARWLRAGSLALLAAIAACAPNAVRPRSDAIADADPPPDTTWFEDYDEADADVELLDVGIDEPEDAGELDAGRPDAGRVDAGRVDSGTGCGPQANTPPAVGTRGVLNGDRRFVQVLVNNIENLEEPQEYCRGDWRNLLGYMRQMRPQPDLFLVQQISDRGQLDELVRAMNGALAGTYAGLIADPDPARFNSPCREPKAKQTNAIVYRTARFAPVGQRLTFQPISAHSGSCRRSVQPRTLYIMHKLRDRVADRDVTAVSLHWATNSGECAQQSTVELQQRLRTAGYAADLVVMGGDANTPDRSSDGSFRAWYRLINGDLGGAMNFRDPIYSRCDRTDALRACLNDNATTSNRIDFLFARRDGRCRPDTAAAHTVTFGEADGHSALHYSDHRAVHAEVYY